MVLLEKLQFVTGLELDPLDGDRKRKREGRLVEPGREQVHVTSNVCVPLRVGLILLLIYFFNVLQIRYLLSFKNTSMHFNFLEVCSTHAELTT